MHPQHLVSASGATRLFGGLLLGWLLTGGIFVLMLLALPGLELAASLQSARMFVQDAWLFIETNLRASILPFTAVLLVWLTQFARLRQLLGDEDPSFARIVRTEQALEQCTGLFFGIGVVWTAIGMRDALLFALGDQDLVQSQSAFSVLQRLVDGGILLALSTTIVGAVGGYLMRIAKSVFLGSGLVCLYMAEAGRPDREQLESLQRIERKLSALDRGGNERKGQT